jgi:hypothetical protein
MGRLLPMALLLPACAFDPSGVASDGAPTSGDARLDAAAPDDGPASDAEPVPPDGAPVPPDAAVDCPTGYVTQPGIGTYRFDGGNVSWTVARDDCADDLPGVTQLVVIGDDAENAHVEIISENRDIWIGLTDADDEGTWVDVLGAPKGYENWAFLEPNNGGIGGNEDCAELLDGSGSWNDRGCGDNRRYVCECTLAP